MAKVTRRTCVECGVTKELSKNFYKVNSIKAIDGRLMICKTCLTNKIPDDTDIDTVKSVFREFNIPYIARYWKSAQNSNKATVGHYISMLSSLQQVKNTTTSMTPDEIMMSASPEYSEEDFESDDFLVTKEMVDFFGSGFKNTEYRKMIETYDRYCEIYPSDLPAQRNYYKYIAITDIQASKALTDGKMTDFAKVMDTYSKLHSDAKIKPVQDLSAEDRFGTLGTFIEMIERDEPIDEALPQFQDVDGIRNYIETFFTKQIKRIFGIGSDESVI